MAGTQQASAVQIFAGPVRGWRADRILRQVIALLRSKANPQARMLKQVEKLQLSPRHTVHLVECGGDRFLIAASSDGISAPVLITRRTDTEEPPR